MMKRNKIILTVFILIMIALIFSGCGGGNPVTPPIEDEEQEYVVEEKFFNVDADQGGTFSLSDGTELKIDPGDLSDDAYVVLKRVRYNDLDFSKSWWADENPYVWFVDILDCDDLLGNVELYMVSSQLEYIGGEISGGIVRLKDGAFELVNEFTASVGEKVLVSIEEIGKTAYLFVTNPVNDVMIINDLIEDIGLAVQYYYDGNCTSLYNLYQQALQEESTAEDDLINHPGVTKEDALEIFDKVFSLKSVIDFAVGLTPVKSGKGFVATAVFSYQIYSAFVGIGEVCKYTNAYMIAKNKSDIYNSKIFKRRVIKYLYEQGCVGNEDGEDFINIISVTPDSGLVEGKNTNFTVVVEYNLYSYDQGSLGIGFNTDVVDRWEVFSNATFLINKGYGTHEFNVTVKPKNWGSEGDFSVWVCIDEVPEIDNILLECDEKILTF